MATQSDGPSKYEVSQGKGVPIKSWTQGVAFDEGAKEQLLNISQLPFIHGWVAAMPDVHRGIGATIGSVIPTVEAIVPAAVGVDIGCGMMAQRTSLKAEDLPESLREMRTGIEASVPHGLSFGRKGRDSKRRDKGSWKDLPERAEHAWASLSQDFETLTGKYPLFKNANSRVHLGTLGTGNHFIEVCLDEEGSVWVMLHSGSRGIGNRIGTHFISLARKEMERLDIQLPDKDLAYFKEGSTLFDDYVFAVGWAQKFARTNRELMMAAVLESMKTVSGLPPFTTDLEAVNCHHNYVQQEHHFGKDVYLTRKGAVRAGKGDLGIIPGSMGAKSYIVQGKGNPHSYESCSHGAGRAMSRTQAKKTFTVEDHEKATKGVECRKDKGVIDETPAAYKDIDAVMEAQSDLVDIVHTLRQVVCVKG
ncbi:MAG: RtcB family protein [Candidatus Eisenbacteria bacterium]|uniref:3'-phosphate/5'-hydroxy nucleic acid ligase n=1 Tax=Eiseniibacteriota bacterium TaxID=2212470 RepID=A0A7Y2EGJ9_UNCEI|nr:RtcB family protein [Candidatus Eisenbacteria bacterium]